MRYHFPYGRSRRPLLVASALVGGDSYCLYHVLYVVQAGSCRGRQGADRKPGGQKQVPKVLVASNDRRIKQGAVLEYSCSVFLASDPIRKVYPKVFILKAPAFFSGWYPIQVSCGGEALLRMLLVSEPWGPLGSLPPAALRTVEMPDLQ